MESIIGDLSNPRISNIVRVVGAGEASLAEITKVRRKNKSGENYCANDEPDAATSREDSSKSDNVKDINIEKINNNYNYNCGEKSTNDPIILARRNCQSMRPFINNSGNAIITSDKRHIMMYCVQYNHMNSVNIAHLSDGVDPLLLRCTTCHSGTQFSRTVVKIMKSEFGMTIHMKVNRGDVVIYYSIADKIEIRCHTQCTNGSRLEAASGMDNCLIIDIGGDTPDVVLFLQETLVKWRRIEPPRPAPRLPFGSAAVMHLIDLRRADAGQLLAIDDDLMLFENV